MKSRWLKTRRAGIILSVSVLLPFLAGCLDRSTISDVRLATIPQSLVVRCDDPVTLPDRAMSGPEAARLWAADRSSLGICRDRQNALAKAAIALENQGGN